MRTSLLLLAAGLVLAGAAWVHQYTVTRAAEPPSAGEIRMVPARLYRPIWDDPLAAGLVAIAVIGVAFSRSRGMRRT
jgi:hypothetical protein